jgi:hypothetical protein
VGGMGRGMGRGRMGTGIRCCTPGLVGGFRRFSRKAVSIRGSLKLTYRKIYSSILNSPTMQKKSINYRVK